MLRSWCSASGRRAADPPGALFSSGALCQRGRWSSFTVAVGNSGAGQRGLYVGFTTAALVHELMEARDERRLLNLQPQLSRLGLLIIDELNQSQGEMRRGMG